MSKPRARAYPLILLAPSGCGKSTVIQEASKRCDVPRTPVQITTRTPRPTLDGSLEETYFFVDQRDFDALVLSGDLIEHSCTHLASYATPVTVSINGQEMMLLTMEADAAARFRSNHPCTMVGLIPAGKEVLRKRLDARQDANPQLLEKRLAQAACDIRRINQLSDYTLLSDNSNWDAVLEGFCQLVSLCAMKTSCLKSALEEVSQSFEA